MLLVYGPVKLYRFLGTWKDTRTGKKARSDVLGKFWFGKALVDIIRDDFIDSVFCGERVLNPGQSIIANVRENLAVSYEWNTFDSLVEMDLPAGDCVQAWTGVTSWQLEYQRKPGGRILGGGFVQYLIYDASLLPAAALKQRSIQQLWQQFFASDARAGCQFLIRSLAHQGERDG